MTKRLPLFFYLIFFFSTVYAQNPEELLNKWSAKAPVEKVYLHLDRENYIAGETAWFKAYLVSDFLPDTISTTLYVELLNTSSFVINRKILPVLLSTSNGQLEMPDTLSTGNYLIRAYTPTMLNQDPEFLFKKSVFIYGKKNKEITKANETATRLEFFPEGGNLVSGFTNTIAFKATNENGFPVTINGSLKNEKNEELATLTTIHDGMGMFELAPSASTKYYVQLNGDQSLKKYYLPQSVDKGIALTIIPHPQGSFFEIHQQKTDPSFQAAYMIGQMQHHVVFKQQFGAGKEEMQGIINTQHLNSGILQVTVFNKDNIPLAERLCFINNKEYIQPAELIADTINFSEKSKNHFMVSMKDTVKGSFSLSVVDPEYDITPNRKENIISSLLLTSDLKGYVHNPAFYFSSEDDSIKTAVDLVMMTNGWRRFKWTELVKSIPLSNYKDPSYITLAGKATLLDSKRAFSEKQLLLFMNGPDSTRSVQMINTDKQGNFRLDSMLFFGDTHLAFSDIRGKQSQYIEVNLSGDSITRRFIIPAMERQPLFIDGTMSDKQVKMGIDFDGIQKANGIMMQGITLKVKKKSAVQELEEKYASGLFSGFAQSTIDLTNTKEVITQDNIFDYLQFRVPGINVLKDGMDYGIYYRQSTSISTLGMIPMTLYLNEMETDASVISTIRASDVAMVKVFSNFVGAVGGGAGGALAIYTKKGADLYNNSPSIVDQLKYNGFSVIKEFYAPDYKADKSAAAKADNRITLDWRPTIFVNAVDPKLGFTFFNNDRTKKYKIVVEGMTNTGKLIFIEKTITSATLKPF